MEKKLAKHIHISDNVATCVADITAGETVHVRFDGVETTYVANQDINFGHKIALRDIPEGEYIIKYGQPIGKATQDIRVGDWVHTHNVKDHYEVQ